MGAVSETLIFSLVDGGCLVLFLLYSRCFFSCEKLLVILYGLKNYITNCNTTGRSDTFYSTAKIHIITKKIIILNDKLAHM